MNTPIWDFVQDYVRQNPARLHMPGHKGKGPLGCEAWDITEIGGADFLYNPQGIIQESQKNAARLFAAAETLYSTEGSSQCIRAMLYLALLAFWEKKPGKTPAIIAGRNAHKTFLTAAALLDFHIRWLYPENQGYSLCQCQITPAQLEQALAETENPAGVYITNPDYLGNTVDLLSLGKIARKWGIPLLVDNAHGAYTRFLSPSCHPMDLGADICCDSAHKTLPVLTGGAYLHISRNAPAVFKSRAQNAMALFGSTSPSYLILQSLDLANRYLAEGYQERLAATVEELKGLKARLAKKGWRFAGDEPVKLTICARQSGYWGEALGEALEKQGIVCEYADRDYVVLMPSPENPGGALGQLEEALAGLEQLPVIAGGPPAFIPPKRVMTVKGAMGLPCEGVSPRQAVGRLAAWPAAACPPAISPVVPGEVVGKRAMEIYEYYGIREVLVATGTWQ